MTIRDDQRVDELRQRLRSLGYLDAGVDRFVLAPAVGARRPAVIAALASVRIGLLAAVLLGPSAAIGIAARVPGLVTGTRDALVVAGYLALLFGVAATVISFIASLIAARLPAAMIGGRARLAARTTGVAVGAVCLAYLTLWWRIANAGAALLSPAWTVFVLGIAVAISLLLGHATSITAFAVMTAAGRGGAVRGEPTSTWRATVAAAIIAFVGAAALLLLATPAPAIEAPPPDLAVVSPGIRLKLIAIDGFDPAAMDALASSGRVPTLVRLFANGSVRLAADAVRDPAREWTTIATGQPPAVHGVQGIETRRVAGLQGTVTPESHGLGRALREATDLLRLTRPSTASGTQLRAKTMWEVAADAGLRSAVINWWATWPATPSGANPPIVISDRATLRLERGGALDGEIAPADLYERLHRDWRAIKDQAASRITAVLPPAAEPQTADALRRAAEVDAVQIAIASRVSPQSLDLLAIYLPGLDIAQHALLGSGEAIAASAMSARLEALRGYYVFLDRLLQDVTAPAADEMLVVVAEPGRIATITRGAMAISGKGAAPNVDVEARTIDIAPTLLHILGLPISRELAGRPVLDVLDNEIAARFSVRHVDTYGQRRSPAGLREGQPLDREMIERLRSLGYVR